MSRLRDGVSRVNRLGGDDAVVTLRQLVRIAGRMSLACKFCAPESLRPFFGWRPYALSDVVRPYSTSPALPDGAANRLPLLHNPTMQIFIEGAFPDLSSLFTGLPFPVFPARQRTSTDLGEAFPLGLADAIGVLRVRQTLPSRSDDLWVQGEDHVLFRGTSLLAPIAGYSSMRADRCPERCPSAKPCFENVSATTR